MYQKRERSKGRASNDALEKYLTRISFNTLTSKIELPGKDPGKDKKEQDTAGQFRIFLTRLASKILPASSMPYFERGMSAIPPFLANLWTWRFSLLLLMMLFTWRLFVLNLRRHIDEGHMRALDLVGDAEFFLPRETELDPEGLQDGIAVIARWYHRDDPLTLLTSLQDAAVAANESMTVFLIDTDPQVDEDSDVISTNALKAKLDLYRTVITGIEIVLIEPEQELFDSKAKLTMKWGSTYGYPETTYALQYALKQKPFSWILFTNSDNNYNVNFLKETAPYRKSDVSMVHFSFITHYKHSLNAHPLYLPLWGDIFLRNIFSKPWATKDPNTVVRSMPKSTLLDLGSAMYNAHLWMEGGVDGCAAEDFTTLAMRMEKKRKGMGFEWADGMLAETVAACGKTSKIPLQVLMFHQ